MKKVRYNLEQIDPSPQSDAVLQGEKDDLLGNQQASDDQRTQRRQDPMQGPRLAVRRSTRFRQWKPD